MRYFYSRTWNRTCNSLNGGRGIAILLFFFLFLQTGRAQDPKTAEQSWWKQNNLRVIQTNLPDYEAATLDPDSLVKDLVDFSANTLLINAGGIMAFYPTQLDFQYTNPYMRPKMLGEVIAKCHARHIRVIVRFDFSRVEAGIFKAHPDWCYLSPKGERIINTNMVVVSINAPYVQDRAFRIISEVMDKYPIDGIFLNMPGYQVNDAYQGKYHGIDQNEYDKKRFFEYSGGLALPTVENKADTLFQKYLAFKQYTVEDWSRRLYELVKAKSPGIAICTYSDKYVDIIRHESQASPLPYWPYTASDNVNNASHSFPHHIISNASIQQISFQSRYNAVEPEECAIRLYENIANGSGLDISLMGDLRGYEDPRNFATIKKIYAHHKKFEAYFGNYRSVARIAVIAPGSWPSGLPMQEYRGILLMLNEAHIPYDIIGDAQMGELASSLKNYRLLILPDISYLNSGCMPALREALRNGTNIIATNTSLYDDPAALQELFGARIVNKENEGSGNYLRPDSPDAHGLFKRLQGQKMVYWKYNLGLYDLSGADARWLPILGKGRPGPPEIIGGHEPTGYFAMGVKNHGKARAIILPENIGRLYYMQGYQEHKNILLDVIDYIFPAAGQQIKTNAPARVETILQEFALRPHDRQTRGSGTENLRSGGSSPEDIRMGRPGPGGANAEGPGGPGGANVERLGPGSTNTRGTGDGLILHLVNLTGFSGNTYFQPLPLYNLSFRIQCPFKPSGLTGMVSGRAIPFIWSGGVVGFSIRELGSFEGVMIRR